MFYNLYSSSTTGGVYCFRQLQLRPAARSSPVGSPRRLAVAKSIFGENNANHIDENGLELEQLLRLNMVKTHLRYHT